MLVGRRVAQPALFVYLAVFDVSQTANPSPDPDLSASHPLSSVVPYISADHDLPLLHASPGPVSDASLHEEFSAFHIDSKEIPHLPLDDQSLSLWEPVPQQMDRTL